MGFDMQQQIYRAYRMGLDSCNTQTLQADNSCPGYLVELSGVMVNVYLMSTVNGTTIVYQSSNPLSDIFTQSSIPPSPSSKACFCAMFVAQLSIPGSQCLQIKNYHDYHYDYLPRHSVAPILENQYTRYFVFVLLVQRIVLCPVSCRFSNILARLSGNQCIRNRKGYAPVTSPSLRPLPPILPCVRTESTLSVGITKQQQIDDLILDPMHPVPTVCT